MATNISSLAAGLDGPAVRLGITKNMGNPRTHFSIVDCLAIALLNEHYSSTHFL
jgi:hypothetical protein